VMARELILTRLREAGTVLVQALEDGVGVRGDGTAQRRDVACAGLQECAQSGLHLRQLLLAGRRHVRRVLLQTIVYALEAARARGDVWAELLDVLFASPFAGTRACAAARACPPRLDGERHCQWQEQSYNL